MQAFDSPPVIDSPQLPDRLRLDRTAPEGVSARSGGAFRHMVQAAIEQLAAPQEAATQAVQAFNRGQDGELHDTLLPMEKADISLKYFVTARNHLLEVYREIVRIGS